MLCLRKALETFKASKLTGLHQAPLRSEAAWYKPVNLELTLGRKLAWSPPFERLGETATALMAHYSKVDNVNSWYEPVKFEDW